jgi:DNA gyrase subunit B/topoisomerase-4 subunit B
VSTSYTAKDITVLQGLEPVRKRPGMYIGGVSAQGLHHLVWEILDNSVDEAMNGFATSIQVTLHEDHSSITVSDDGRGIPVDKHPKVKKSALEVILTTLHAGGKFDGQNYKTAGGLHGVGASVVNALSSHLVATVKRDGHIYQMEFKQGRAVTKLKTLGRGRGTGTTITFHPDPKIFPKTKFQPEILRERLATTSYLHQGLRISFHDEATDDKAAFQQNEGLTAYLKKILEERKAKPAHEVPFVLKREGDARDSTRIEIVMQWTESTDEHVRSYVNGIPTASGGSHENGFRSGLSKALRNYVDAHKLTPKGVTLATEDLREGLTAVLSVFITDPQFQGQTKDRLNNPELQQTLDAAVRPALELWLNQNRSTGDAIVARIILASRAREASRAASEAIVRKTATRGRMMLPGKLSDCASSRSSETELFIV